MPDRRRLNLAFNLEHPQHKKAWDTLSHVPYGQRTELVCRLLCSYTEQEKLLEQIQKVVREELQHVKLIQANIDIAPTERESVTDDVLAFLRALQEEGEKTDSLF